MDNHEDLEKGSILSLDFSKLNQIGSAGHPVLPVVVQDSDSGVGFCATNPLKKLGKNSGLNFYFVFL